jgi:hypothetical protein
LSALGNSTDMNESKDKPMLSKEQWKVMNADSVAVYHGFGSFLEFLLTQDIDSEGGLKYDAYMKWYLQSFSPLGKAMQ